MFEIVAYTCLKSNASFMRYIYLIALLNISIYSYSQQKYWMLTGFVNVYSVNPCLFPIPTQFHDPILNRFDNLKEYNIFNHDDVDRMHSLYLLYLALCKTV